jgi:hypothetical protein
METIIAVLFGMFFGFILTKGFIMIFKKETPSQKTGTGGGGYYPSEDQDGQDDKDKFEHIQE